MIAGASITFAAIDDASGALVGFTRVLTDGVFLAMILDVIVQVDRRGDGIGGQLVAAVLDDPRIGEVRSIELVCQPELVPFYRRWGFTDKVGRSRLMRRTADPALTP